MVFRENRWGSSFGAAASLSVLVAALAVSCGGGGGPEQEAEDAVQTYLLRDDVRLVPGRNPRDVMVTMRPAARDAFDDRNRTIEDVFVEDTSVAGDTATASVSFLVATIGETWGCEGTVALDRRGGSWQPRTFTITSCR